MLTFTQWWVRQRYEGRFTEAGAAMAELLGGSGSGPPVTAAPRAVAALQAGDRDKARVLLEQWWAAGLADRPRDSEWLPETAQLAEAAVLTGFGDLAALLYEQLRPLPTAVASRGSPPRAPARWRGTSRWWRVSSVTIRRLRPTMRRPARPTGGLVWWPSRHLWPGRQKAEPRRTGTSTATSAELVCEGANLGRHVSRVVPDGYGTARVCGTWPLCWPDRSRRRTAWN